MTWQLGPQTREAQLAAMEARIKAACDHHAAEASNPRNPVLREFNRLSADARRDGCNLDLAGGLELARRNVAARQMERAA